MIELIDDLPDNVLAIVATDRVTRDDYLTVVAPAAETCRAAHETLRLLCHFPPDFRKLTTTSLWDDPHIGLYRLQGFERVAVVTDVDWLQALVNKIHPGESTAVRLFAHARLDEARDWICG